ncbi:MAG: DJ-1/PfpI family protein [Lachnospiraceae bacterium]|jgi:4-methyl-5(b-hydroxyethyl)-thiazole monophosphate biosynthesis|nr:DJ-1/PfpI family protein [Lachnospiraceae bacterium]
MKKVGVFFAEGFEEIEGLTVVDILRRAGIETEMISITADRKVTGGHGITIMTDATIDQIEGSALAMIVLPGGGQGTANLEACESLMTAVDEFHARQRPIAAICAAPSILGHRGILQGRVACSYPDFEGHLHGATVSREPAVCDGHVITGRGMGCAIQFSLAIVEYLKSREAADQIATSIIFS